MRGKSSCRRKPASRTSLDWTPAFAGVTLTKFCVLSFGFCLLTCRLVWAARTCSEEGLYMVAKAADCLDHQDVGCAKLKLDTLLEREPNCAEALFVKGWVLQYADLKAEAGHAMQ